MWLHYWHVTDHLHFQRYFLLNTFKSTLEHVCIHRQCTQATDSRDMHVSEGDDVINEKSQEGKSE